MMRCRDGEGNLLMEGVTICCFADMYRKYSAKSSPVGKVGNTDLGKVPDTAWKAPDTAF